MNGLYFQLLIALAPIPSLTSNQARLPSSIGPDLRNLLELRQLRDLRKADVCRDGSFQHKEQRTESGFLVTYVREGTKTEHRINKHQDEGCVIVGPCTSSIPVSERCTSITRAGLRPSGMWESY